MRYTKTDLELLVKTSGSLTEVAVKLGLKPSGGNRSNIGKKIRLWGIDASHFTKEKYTKQLLSEVVAKCVSMSEVVRELGRRPGGGTHAFIKRKIAKHGIDTSHFTGQKTNSGDRHKGNKGRSWQEVLVKKTEGCRETSYILRRALIASGRQYKCEGSGCVVVDDWCGNPIRLHIHHKDGDWLNNTQGNLEFRCPNCHSQTVTYCAGNRNKERSG